MKTYFIPEVANLHRVLHATDSYNDWANEYLNRQSQKKSISVGEAKLWYSEDTFDSDVFGMKVGKVEAVVGENTKDIQAVLQELFSTMRYDYCLFRLAQQHIKWIQLIEQKGALFLDSTVDLVCDFSDPIAQNARINQHVTTQLDPTLYPQIFEISKSFKYGRFFTDPRIDKGTQIYRLWIENSLKLKAADLVFTYQHKNTVQAFATLKSHTLGSLNGVKIPLVGKHMDSEIPHVASVLLEHIIATNVQEKKRFLLISTQSTNIPALLSYLHAGCKPYSSEVTLGWSRR